MTPRPQSTLLESQQTDAPGAPDTTQVESALLPNLVPSQVVYNVKNSDVSVVISGIGGRYPESNSVDEFADNLYGKVDMITEDNRRWPTNLYEMNHRMAKVKDIDRFDGAFFGWRQKMGDSVDPQARMLLETTYEAICDSGVNPQTLRGSRTGVYVGSSTIGMPDGLPPTIDPSSRHSLTESMSWIQGNSKSMYANRVSFFFDFRGPSMTIDTACSSSMVAFDIAVTDIKCGKVDNAIVSGVNINLQAFTNYFYQKLGFNAPDGLSKVWDKDADGFVRGETVASLFLQREPDAKRVYSRIIHSRTNIDGYKRTGMFFPSSDGQRDLLVQTYKEANISPNDVTYFEAHGTGTKAGDFQEAFAIHRAYCTSGRTSPLPIGLLKSNIGHGEAASGVASLTKVILAFENERIPANLNLKEVKPNIAELKLLKPIQDNLDYTPGIAGVNSFGVGGVNGHVLLEPNYKVPAAGGSHVALPNLPRLVPLHGRTKESVEHFMNFIENNSEKVTPEFLALIADIFKYKPMLTSAGFPYRGTLLIKNETIDGVSDVNFYRSDIEPINIQFRSQMCFFYSGIGSQTAALAKEFNGIDIFSTKLRQLALVLKPHGVNLVDLLTNESSEDLIRDSVMAKFVSTTAFQVILTDILINDLEVTPEVIIGHSFGEIAAAYAQGYISAEEAVLISYHRGDLLEQARDKIPLGRMAAVGMSFSEASDRCPKNVFVACNNAPKLVTLSGEKKAMKKFLEKLASEDIFVREVDSAEYPLHSPYLEVVKEQLLERIAAVFAATRGKKTQMPIEALKWMSTCQTPEFMEELHIAQKGDKFSSRLAQYFIDNLLKPVNFCSTLGRISGNALVLEIAGRELFEKVISKTKSTFKYLPLIRGAARTPEAFLGTLSDLYRSGFNLSVENLYPAVQWPVPRGTQSISSLLKWDHSETYFVKLYPDYFFKATAADLIVDIDPDNPENDYLFHHVIDGRNILPGTAMLMFAWKRFSDSKTTPWTKLPVQFDDVQLRRPVFFDRNQKTTLKVRLLDPTGEFVILEGENICCTGTIRELKGSLDQQDVLEKFNEMGENMKTITSEDIYKDFHVRGYEYGPKFRCIVDYSTDLQKHSIGNVRWIGHMISFLDNLMQIAGPVMPIKELHVPIVFQKMKIDPIILFDAIQQNNISSSEVKDVPTVSEFVDDSEMNDDEMEEMRSKLSKITGEADQVKNADSVIRAYCDLQGRAIVAPGVEINNVTLAFIGRKMHPEPVAVESHEFVANHESQLSSENALKLQQYEQVTATECQRLLTEFNLGKLGSTFGKWDTALEKSTIEKNHKAKEGNALLRIVNLSLADLKEGDENNNCYTITEEEDVNEADSLDKFSCLISDSALKLSKSFADESELLDPILRRRTQLDFIHSDMLAGVAHEDRMIRPLVDLVAESFAFSKEFHILQLSPVQHLPLAFKVDRFLASSSIFKLNIGYTLAHPVVGISNVEIPFNFNNQNWDIQEEQLWPKNVNLKQQTHLAVLYDEPLFQELQLTDGNFWSKVDQSVIRSGYVLLLFRSKLSPIERFIYESIFNVKAPTNEELQQRVESATQQAAKAGFFTVASKSAVSGQIALLLGRKQTSEVGSFSTVVYETDEDTWLASVKEKLKAAADGIEETVWLLADEKTLPGALGFFNCIRKEPGGRQFRLLFLLDASKGEAAELFKKEQTELTSRNLAVNIYKDGSWGTYRYGTLNLLNATRLSTEYHLNIGTNRNDLGNLTLFDSTNLRQIAYVPPMAPPELLERKYAVYSSALNFRDVMLASGRIFPPIQMLTQHCSLGSEFAGRDCETGERVFGILNGGSFATTVYMPPRFVRPIPDHWSYDDAVGIVTTYNTVWYGLIHKARLERGSTVLIHSAAGGVGQAALHVCKAYGCTVYVTVGNAEKRKFLNEKFGVPYEHMFSSRDCQFEKEIRRLTKGEGIKFILNSLIGEQLDASLRLIADNGHFIELAKFEMQMNKRIGTFPFLRNLTYHGVAIEQTIYKEPQTVAAFYDWLLSNCGPNDAVQPLTCHVFPIKNAVTAFRFMTSGKHMGKIVIRLREDDADPTAKVIAPSKPLQVHTRTHFEADKTYIVVGGCGGVGLEMTHWLVKKGAKRIVLTSRSTERTAYQALSLGALSAIGDHFPFYSNEVTIYSEDISTEEGIRRMLAEVTRNGSQIGGIFHLAVSLNDTLLENMTLEAWHKTVNSKATFASILDKVTREVCPDLDYFVCFSSVSSGRGNVGQTNYGYANSVLDRICEQRRKEGFHGLSIQYGPIGDVGMLSDANDRAAFANVRLQRIMSVLDVLNRAMQSDCAVVSSLVFSDRSQQENMGGGDSMLQHLWSALGVDPDTLPDHVTLGELGMESMFAIEMQQTIEQEFGVRFTLQEIKLMTVGELKSSKNEKTEQQEKLKRVKEFKNYLLSVNLSLPSISIEALNTATQGEPIFLLPGVMGIIGLMRVFASRLSNPVIALHITREVNSSHVSVKMAADYYMNLLRREYPDIKRFNLLGFDYGSIVAMKMARKGFPCRVAVIDLNSTEKKVNLEDDKVYDQLIEFLVEVLMAGALSDEANTKNAKERMLSSVSVEVTFDGKVKAVSQEIQRLQENKVKTEEIEEVIAGSLRRAQSIFEYDMKVSQKKEKLHHRLMGRLGKAQGRFLVIKDRNSGGMLTSYLNDLTKESSWDSPINLLQEAMAVNTYVELLDKFYSSK